MTPDDIPQLPHTSPHERFHSAEEWEGAMKLVDYLLTRLHPTDKMFVWDAFANAVTSGEERQSPLSAWLTPAAAAP